MTEDKAKMDFSNVVFTSRVAIAVRFRDQSRGWSNAYTYWAPRDSVKVGSWVVVEATDGTFSCAKVHKTEGLSKAERDKASKWIVSVVDIAEYRERQRREVALQAVKDELRQRREEMEDIILYQQLAQSDSVIGELMQRYNDIASGKMQLPEKASLEDDLESDNLL